MTPPELTRDEVIDEVKKLQCLYGLKYESRYAHDRGEVAYAESVAEHIYGLHILALYFLPLEDPKEAWDRTRIFELITIHDIDEIETGDTIGYLKTDANRAAEADSMRAVLSRAPAHMQTHLGRLVDEYEAQETPEARFVKALDRFEPLIHLYNENGRKTMQRNQTTLEHSRQLKQAYVAPYPYLKHFTEILQSVMVEEGYFWRPDAD